jgi:hypothetical protein
VAEPHGLRHHAVRFRWRVHRRMLPAMTWTYGKTLVLALATAAPLACSDDGVTSTDGSSSSSSTGEPTTMSATVTLSASGSSSSADETTTTTDTGSSSDGGTSTGGSESTTTAATGESTSSSESSSSSESGFVPMHCPYAILGPELPDVAFGNTTDETDDFAGTCGGNGNPELGVLFTAPAAGTYTFDTHGSQLHTVLYVLDGECGGTELACNDNGDGPQSAVAVDLAADQTVTVIVDSETAQGDPFNVRVQEGSLVCPYQDLGNTVPTMASADSSYAFNGSAGTCGGAGGSDLSFLFTAPNTGVFSFDTFGSDLDSRVYVRNGVCGGAEIACGLGGVLASLTNGQQVTVVVDSTFGGGPFTLNVGALTGTCPDEDLGNTVPQTPSNTTIGGSNFSAGSCGGFGSNDYSYTFTAATQGIYAFDTAGSDFETVLYLRDGSCGGTELDCVVSTMGQGAHIDRSLVAGEQVVITVDGDGAEGNFQLSVDFSPTSGDCCVSHNYTGCEVPDIEDCVCALDGFCCSNSWDGICAGEALDCGALCPM